MPFSTVEKARVRRALGYVNATHGSVLSFGVPIANDFLFVVEDRMDQLIEPEGLELVREDLGRVEATRDQIFEAQERLAAKKIDGIETNPDELKALFDQLKWWSRQLAEGLGVPAHVYSWAGGAGPGGVNVPVV